MIGLTPIEAAKRLDAQGAAYEIKLVLPRKRVLGKTEQRVMRVRERAEANGPVLELLVGEFRVFENGEERIIE